MRQTIIATQDDPMDPVKMHQLANEGWTLIDGWRLKEGHYGKGAMNLVFQRDSAPTLQRNLRKMD